MNHELKTNDFKVLIAKFVYGYDTVKNRNTKGTQ